MCEEGGQGELSLGKHHHFTEANQQPLQIPASPGIASNGGADPSHALFLEPLCSEDLVSHRECRRDSVDGVVLKAELFIVPYGVVLPAVGLSSFTATPCRYGSRNAAFPAAVCVHRGGELRVMQKESGELQVLVLLPTSYCPGSCKSQATKWKSSCSVIVSEAGLGVEMIVLFGCAQQEDAVGQREGLALVFWCRWLLLCCLVPFGCGMGTAEGHHMASIRTNQRRLFCSTAIHARSCCCSGAQQGPPPPPNSFQQQQLRTRPQTSQPLCRLQWIPAQSCCSHQRPGRHSSTALSWIPASPIPTATLRCGAEICLRCMKWVCFLF